MTVGAGQDQAISIPKMGSLEMPFHSSRVNLRDGNNGGFTFGKLLRELTLPGARETTPLQLEAKGYFLGI